MLLIAVENKGKNTCTHGYLHKQRSSSAPVVEQECPLLV